MSTKEPIVGSGATVTACKIIEDGIKTNAEIESMRLEYGLYNYVANCGSISKTMAALQQFAVESPGHRIQTDTGETPVSRFVVEEAIRRFGWRRKNAELWDKLERYLNLDGFALLKEVEDDFGNEIVRITGLTLAMPDFAELPESENEVELLLSRYGFDTAKHHLSRVKENITQGDWESANSQCRTFLEALTDAIAETLYPTEAANKKSGHQKRQLLANKGFLSKDKHEFSDGKDQAYIPGLTKLLHPDGPHPGISTQHDAIFRLQIVVVTARWLLKRLENEKSNGGRV
jgi:hypothetical protein